jgi:thioredoxin 1
VRVRETTEGQWEADVLQAERPVLVDFWAEWCQPCKMMEPILAKLAAQYADRLDVIKVDVQAHPDVAMRYDVMNLPTLAVFRDGQLVETLPGYMPFGVLEGKLKGYL